MWTTTVDDRRSFCGKFRCSAQQNATLTRGQSLGGLERERTEVTDCACAATVPFRAVGMRTVLNHDQVIRFGKCHDRVHICHVRAKMHGNDRSCFWRDGSLCRFWVEAVIVWVNIYDHWDGSGCHRRGGGCLECVCRYDDLIPPTDARSSQRDLH